MLVFDSEERSMPDFIADGNLGWHHYRPIRRDVWRRLIGPMTGRGGPLTGNLLCSSIHPTDWWDGQNDVVFNSPLVMLLTSAGLSSTA